MEYASSTEMAKIWNISSRRIAILCEQNRIVGARKIGGSWLIPKGSEKPRDERRKKI